MHKQENTYRDYRLPTKIFSLFLHRYRCAYLTAGGSDPATNRLIQIADEYTGEKVINCADLFKNQIGRNRDNNSVQQLMRIFNRRRRRVRQNEKCEEQGRVKIRSAVDFRNKARIT